MRTGFHGLIAAAIASAIVLGGCGTDDAERGSKASRPGTASTTGSNRSGTLSDVVDGGGGSDGSVPSTESSPCQEMPTVPAFSVGGADDLDPAGWRVDGQVTSLDVDDGRVAVGVSRAGGNFELVIERSGVTEVSLDVGGEVTVEYRLNQGFEGEARAVRMSDQAGLVLLVEDGDYGNALLPDEIAPFTVGQVDIGCRNRPNAPGSLNNFALTIEAEGTSVELLPGERSVLSVDGSDYAVRNLRSTARHSDVQWTDAPYAFTSFSIARLPG